MYVVAKHSFCYYGYNLKLKFSLEKAIPKLRIWICNAYVSNLCEITEGRKIHEKKNASVGNKGSNMGAGSVSVLNFII